MNEEIKTLLEAIKSQVLQSTNESKSAVETQIAAFEAKMATIESVDELKSMIEAIQEHADKLDIKLQSNESGTKSVGYLDQMVGALTKGFEQIKNVKKGQGAVLEIKDAVNMTVDNSMTVGTSVNTYRPGVVMVPSQKINFADLVQTVNSATGNYYIYEEVGVEGGITEQTTPGTSKTQISYEFAGINYVANYISGFARYAKQMAQDLPFLTSFLPNALRRDYFKAENNIFKTALLSLAPTLVTTKTVAIEMLVDAIGQLENLDFDVTGIVLNPRDWANIAITKSTESDYTLPGIVQISNGQLTVNGVPVYKASWMAVDTFLLGDWNYAKKVLVDGLAVEFFEQDADNVTKNLITARVESRTVLAIEKRSAFLQGDFGNVSI
jgi:hypothetical protein